MLLNIDYERDMRPRKTSRAPGIIALVIAAAGIGLLATTTPIRHMILNSERAVSDSANERASYTAAALDLANTGAGGPYYYDADTGSWSDSYGDIRPYGLCSDHAGGVIACIVDGGGVSPYWAYPDSASRKPNTHTDIAEGPGMREKETQEATRRFPSLPFLPAYSRERR